jgi:release factor glutamine methyltransferase
MHPPVLDPLTFEQTVARLRAAGCVYAEEEAQLLCESARGDELHARVQRRVEGVPLEQVLGWALFCGLRVAVEEGVFVPRRRSEFLVQQAIGVARPGMQVLDLCCGSGAIGMAVAAAVPSLSLSAADIDEVAVRCARRNLAPWRAAVCQGDLFAPLPLRLQGRIDLLTVNAPYVPTEALESMPREARLHEPRFTLDGGPDGCEIQRRVAAEAAAWLAPGGHLLIETAEQQAQHTAAAFERAGLATRIARCEYHDATVVIAARPR